MMECEGSFGQINILPYAQRKETLKILTVPRTRLESNLEASIAAVRNGKTIPQMIPQYTKERTMMGKKQIWINETKQDSRPIWCLKVP